MQGVGRDQAGARRWYEAGAQHIQTFYGQLSAEKLGHTTLTLPGAASDCLHMVKQIATGHL